VNQNMNQSWVNRGKEVIMNTYSQFPISLVKGEGVYVWDGDGKKYLDFVAGIAVNSLGYNHSTYVKQVSAQLEKLSHVSNLYWMPPSIELAEVITKNSIFDKVFYCNSGAEANEAAIKLARKYGKKKHGNLCYEIISMENSFHGRTLATVTATGQTKYQKGFSPLLSGFLYVEFNNFDALKYQVSDQTCAILLEPIQGEGGIQPATKDFLQKVRNLCDEKDIVLIFDEVQCGIGRTGELFAYQNYGVVPDVITLAKGLGGGLPIGAMAAVQSKADALMPGDHASTFGGNYISCTGGKVVMNELITGGVLTNVKKQGDYLLKKLTTLKTEFPFISEIRGMGLMLGMELTISPKEIIQDCMDEGLLLISAGQTVIRFVPPLIVTKVEIDEAIEILQSVLQNIQNSN
jgi:acetylornithine/N-succinyldiaminopimelate aminotransferase